MRFPSVLVIGAAAFDRIATTDVAPARPQTSNPGRIEGFPGGAARNVAEALARLGVPAQLVARVGADGDGAEVLASAARAGVDVSLCLREAGARTPGYLAVHDATGEIVIGVADMAAADTMPAAFVRKALEQAPEALIFVDANLGPRALETVFDSGRAAAACTISAQKSLKLQDFLPKMTALFLNRFEAEALTGASSAAPAALVHALMAKGVPRGVVTLGESGALAFEGAETALIPAVSAQIVSTNGAGDTLAAATLALWRRGLPFIEAARGGVRAAALTVASRFAVSPELCEERLMFGTETPRTMP